MWQVYAMRSLGFSGRYTAEQNNLVRAWMFVFPRTADALWPAVHAYRQKVVTIIGRATGRPRVSPPGYSANSQNHRTNRSTRANAAAAGSDSSVLNARDNAST